MAPTPEQTSLAANPSTDAQTLADLAHAEPELWPAIAAHPNAYPGLIDWMHDNGMPDASQNAGLITESAATTGPVPTAAQPEQPAAPLSPFATAASRPPARRRYRVPLLAAAAVVIIVGLVVGGLYAVSSFTHPNGSAASAGAPASPTDYRFGAKQTWQTTVKVLASESDGSADDFAQVQAYPGLWLVSWPGEDSGTGRLADETELGLDPDTGAVKWSLSPGPYECAPSLTAGALACTDTSKASLVVLDPATGRATDSPLNGAEANSVDTYQGDLVFAYENPANVEDTIERVKLDGTVLWKKSESCAGEPSEDGMTFSTAGELNAAGREAAGVGPDDGFVYGACLSGTINLDTGAINANASVGDDSCLQYSPFQDSDGMYTYGDACASNKYPMLIPRGDSTLTAITMDNYLNNSETDESEFPTLWSAQLPGAALSGADNSNLGAVDLGANALLVSAGHLYGIDTARGPSWEQPNEFSGDGQVLLLAVDATKQNTPVLALDVEHERIRRLDPGTGAVRVSAEPAKLPSCPKGLTPVSFTTWDGGNGATLVCGGFGQTVTVVLIVGGKTYTAANGSLTPTGYHAEFGGNVSVDIGLGGWVAWVDDGGTTTVHAASSGWQMGDARAQSLPPLSEKVPACPADTYPLSLSTWQGGWLLTCGEKSATITRFVYVDGSAHGSGHAMTTKGGQSCGTDSAGRRVCVSANPAVVAFTSKSGAQTQRSVSANYVVGKGFSGAGKGTGAYGLADPAASASSEVAYLNGILQQSEAARANVKTVIQNILKCASVQADVQNAQAVVADRTAELQALNTAPVDAVPGGSALVAQLTTVLQDSLTADQSYVTAAGQVAGGQCPTGRATYGAQNGLITQITNEKGAFASAWNGQIASAYGTPSYTQDDL